MDLQTQAGEAWDAEMYRTWTNEAKGRMKQVTAVCLDNADNYNTAVVVFLMQEMGWGSIYQHFTCPQ